MEVQPTLLILLLGSSACQQKGLDLEIFYLPARGTCSPEQHSESPSPGELSATACPQGRAGRALLGEVGNGDGEEETASHTAFSRKEATGQINQLV